MKNRINLFGDRHFNAPSFGQADCRCSRKDSFGNHAMHASNDFRQLSSATEFDAYAAIARKPAGTGEDEIAQSCESGHGVGTSAASHGQPRHFGQAAGNQCRHGIVPEFKAGADSGGDGDYALQSAA
jgi:hypothetical protein